MKKLRALLLVISVMGLACNSDDDTATDPPAVTVSESDLTGNWQMSDMVCSDGKVVLEFTGVPVPVTNDFTAQGKAFAYTANFSAAPNSVSGSGQFTVDIVVTPPIGNAINDSFDLVSVPFLDMASWSLDGNALTTDSVLLGTKSVTIVEISDSVLKIQGEISTMIPLGVLENLEIENATISEISGTATITFTKQM